MNRILYPTPGTKGDSPPKSNNHRASAQASDDDRDPSSDTRAGGSGASIIGHVSNGFEGLTPLEMVEKITKMAEAKMTVSQGKLLRTHTVDPALMTTAAATSSYADETAGGMQVQLTPTTILCPPRRLFCPGISPSSSGPTRIPVWHA